jgi:hypothetical protein
MSAPAEIERFWNVIVDYIADKRVVPIVGEELLSYRGVGENPCVFLYDILAEKFEIECGARFCARRV